MKSSNYYKRLLLTLLLSALLVLALVACDGGTGDNGTSETPAGAEGGDPADSSTADRSDNGTTDPSDPSDPSDSGTTGNGGSSTTGGNAGVEDDVTTGGSSVTTGGNGGTSGSPEVTPPAGTETVTYTVIVVDGAGEPVKNVIVKLSTGKEGVTGTNGKATIKASAGEYTFTLEKLGGDSTEFAYDTTLCVLSTSAPSVTITFMEKIPDAPGGDNGGDDSQGGSSSGNQPTGETISADPDGDGERASYFASYVGTGTFLKTLTANDMTYILFVPTVSGQYRISATASGTTVSVGYYGMTHFVQTQNVADVKGDGYVELNVKPGSISSDGAGTYVAVIGLKAANGAAVDATVKIERFADHKTDISDLPKENLQADAQYLKSTPAGNGTLTDIDITQASLTIVKGSDGYYHLGSEAGSIVMVRITSASQYIDSFQKIGDNQSISHYESDASGKPTKKICWNEVVSAMAEYVNDDGVVPLNDQLLEMLEKVGEHMGWWDETNGQYLFSEVNENPEIAYLFACCYYA